MTNKNIIAIDGPAASGKGTLARKIAEHLGYAHMDTGLLYRAVAFIVLEGEKQPNDETAAVVAAGVLATQFKDGNTRNSISHNPTLKDEHITGAASFVASMPPVRAILLDLQKNFAANPGAAYKGAVLDGRDIGTVICPHAPAKLFVTAALETRADRRFKELQNKGIAATYEAVLRDMRDRDARDASRSASPMKVAADAVELDTTHLNQEQALAKALEIVEAKLRAARSSA